MKLQLQAKARLLAAEKPRPGFRTKMVKHGKPGGAPLSKSPPSKGRPVDHTEQSRRGHVDDLE